MIVEIIGTIVFALFAMAIVWMEMKNENTP
jgi:hypothetical protein